MIPACVACTEIVGEMLALTADAPDGSSAFVDRNVATKLRVVRAVDLAHSTGSKKGEDFVGTEARTRSKGHCSFRLSLHAPL
jgi:hypothetical protein